MTKVRTVSLIALAIMAVLAAWGLVSTGTAYVQATRTMEGFRIEMIRLTERLSDDGQSSLELVMRYTSVSPWTISLQSVHLVGYVNDRYVWVGDWDLRDANMVLAPKGQAEQTLTLALPEGKEEVIMAGGDRIGEWSFEARVVGRVSQYLDQRAFVRYVSPEEVIRERYSGGILTGSTGPVRRVPGGQGGEGL